MPRDVFRDPGQEAGERGQFRRRIIEARHDQRDDFQPEAHFVDARDRIEDRLQPPAQLVIAAVVETLEIDFVEIHPRSQVLERRGVAFPLDT